MNLADILAQDQIARWTAEGNAEAEAARTRVKCRVCLGEGEVDCGQCDGYGALRVDRGRNGRWEDSWVDSVRCDDCDRGRKQCPQCQGAAWEEIEPEDFDSVNDEIVGRIFQIEEVV